MNRKGQIHVVGMWRSWCNEGTPAFQHGFHVGYVRDAVCWMNIPVLLYHEIQLKLFMQKLVCAYNAMIIHIRSHSPYTSDKSISKQTKEQPLHSLHCKYIRFRNKDLATQCGDTGQTGQNCPLSTLYEIVEGFKRGEENSSKWLVLCVRNTEYWCVFGCCFFLHNPGHLHYFQRPSLVVQMCTAEEEALSETRAATNN